MRLKAREVSYSSLAMFSALIFAAVLFSWIIDPRDFFYNQVFLYDTLHFSELAKSWKRLLYESTPGVPAPFVSRIGFPLFSGVVASYTGFSLTFSAYLIEMAAIIFVVFFLVRDLLTQSISKKITLIFLIYFLFSWNYPLRMAGSWPAFGNAVGTLAVYWAYLMATLAQKRCSYRSILLIVGSIFGTLLREIFLLTILLVCVLGVVRNLYFRLNAKNDRRQSTLVCSGYITRLAIFCLIPSVLFYGYLQTLSSNSPNILEYAIGYLSLLWMHLNLGSFIYVIFSAFGLPILFICLVIIGPQTRSVYVERISKSQDLRKLVDFCLIGIFISIVFGGDSERYLTWFFPFVAVLSAIALEDLLRSQSLGKAKIVLTFSIFILGSRMLVPNLPHMFLVQNSTYCSTAGVKTNYDPSVFYGPSFMEAFRLPVKEVPKEDLPRNAKDFIRGSDVWQIKGEGSPMVAAGKYECENGVKGPYFNNYRHELNNIPVPFGFQHNQFEVYSSWSWWADWRAQLIYILQWIMAVVILGFPSRIGRRSKETLDY